MSMNYGGFVFFVFDIFAISNCHSATWQRDKSKLETNEEVLKRRRKRRSLLIDESHSTLIIWTMISFNPRPRSSTTGDQVEISEFLHLSGSSNSSAPRLTLSKKCHWTTTTWRPTESATTMLATQKLKVAHESDKSSLLFPLPGFQTRQNLRNYLQLVFNLSTQYFKAAFL